MSSISDAEAEAGAEPGSPPVSLPRDKTAEIQARKIIAFTVVLYVLIFVVMVGMVPMFVRMEELSICRAYYNKHDPGLVDAHGNVEEELCKADEVQAELAFVSGWLWFFETVPGILLGLPFGRLADRRGRRIVFALNLFPLHASALWIAAVCYFYTTFQDPKILWISALGYLVGGGPQMFGTALFAMVVDVTVKDDRARAFVFLSLVLLVIDLVLAEGGSFLLDIGLYIPLKIGIPISALSLPVILLMPETLPKPKLGLHSEPRERRDDEQPLLEGSDTSTMCSKRRGPIWKLRSRFRIFFTQLRTLPLELLLTFLIFFIGVLDQGTFAHIVQYTSKRLNWTIAEAGKLVPLVSIFKLAILLVLPATMRFLRLRGWSTEGINAFIIVASLIATATANLVFAFCSSWQQFTIGLLISAFGCAISPALRSKATELVPNTSIAHLYSAITVVQAIARLAVGPIFSYGFRAGLEIGMLGLPFVIVAAAHVFVAVISMMFYA